MAYAASSRPAGGHLNGFRYSANSQAIPQNMKKCGHCQARGWIHHAAPPPPPPPNQQDKDFGRACIDPATPIAAVP